MLAALLVLGCFFIALNLYVPGFRLMLEKFIYTLLFHLTDAVDELEQQCLHRRIRGLAKHEPSEKSHHANRLQEVMKMMASEYPLLLLQDRRHLRLKRKHAFMFGLAPAPAWMSWERLAEHKKSVRHNYMDVVISLEQNEALMQECLHLLQRSHCVYGERATASLIEEMTVHTQKMDLALKKNEATA